MDMHETTQNNESLEYEVGELTPDDLAAMSGGATVELLGVQLNPRISVSWTPPQLPIPVPPINVSL